MTERQKKDLYKIIITVILFAVCLILCDFFSVTSLCYLIPYGLISFSVLLSALKNILHGQIFDENFLMAVASIGALIMGNDAEAVAVMLFYEIGELFEKIAVGRSRSSIASLMSLRPDTATVLSYGEETIVDADEINVGDILVIRPGERIAVDGVVIYGSANLDTSALTGEAVPRAVKTGDEVLSGCVVLDGMIRLKTTREIDESTVSRILELVENSSLNKSKSEDFITKFAKWYTPCVVISAVCIALVPLFVKNQIFSDWIHRALMFLVVSCPCALVVSVPLTYFGAIGGASKKGILIKGSNFLEALNEVDTAVFDKTRTLTTGVFHIERTNPVGISSQELINIAASAEKFSNHPLADAVKAAKTKDIEAFTIKDIPGKGVEAETEIGKVHAGNMRLMTETGINIPENEDNTCIYISVNGEYKGAIYLSDTVKENALSSLNTLREMGVKNTVMLTGDNAKTAEKVSRTLNLSEAHASLLPEDKVACLEEIIKTAKGKVIYAGDGINDAPVLMRADIGIAMGAAGSDAAMEASDIVLMHDDLDGLCKVIALSKKTHAIVTENIIFALSVKFLILLLSALGLAANMWYAVFADVGVLIIAILNAIRTMK